MKLNEDLKKDIVGMSWMVNPILFTVASTDIRFISNPMPMGITFFSYIFMMISFVLGITVIQFSMHNLSMRMIKNEAYRFTLFVLGLCFIFYYYYFTASLLFVLLVLAVNLFVYYIVRSEQIKRT